MNHGTRGSVGVGLGGAAYHGQRKVRDGRPKDDALPGSPQARDSTGLEAVKGSETTKDTKDIKDDVAEVVVISPGAIEPVIIPGSDEKADDTRERADGPGNIGEQTEDIDEHAGNPEGDDSAGSTFVRVDDTAICRACGTVSRVTDVDAQQVCEVCGKIGGTD